MRDIDDLPEDLATLAKNAQQLTMKNAKKIEALKRKYSIEFHTESARFHHFVKSLVSSGIVTEEFYWTEYLNWEEDLSRQLKGAEARIQAQIQAALEEQRKAVGQQLAVPGEKRLILPGE